MHFDNGAGLLVLLITLSGAWGIAKYLQRAIRRDAAAPRFVKAWRFGNVDADDIEHRYFVD